MNESHGAVPNTLKERGILRSRYSLNDVTENILISVEERTGKPMKYGVYGNASVLNNLGEARHFVQNTLRKAINQAKKIPEWQIIDDYIKGKIPEPRQLNEIQIQFLFNLIKQEFKSDLPPDQRNLRAQHLWDSGLTPDILDYVYNFMFSADKSLSA